MSLQEKIFWRGLEGMRTVIYDWSAMNWEIVQDGGLGKELGSWNGVLSSRA